MTVHMAISGLVFVVSLVFIFAEKFNRVIAATVGAALMVGAGLAMGFYSEEEAILAIDFETIGLLLGMMVMVTLLEPTGFFQFLAVWAGRLSRGNPVRLLVLLGTVTTLLSMFLDNVTTVVLIAPVTILISEILGINAIPLLMAEALLSNTGGVATLVGDPPNVLIASAAGFSFNDFLTHSLPIVVLVWVTALWLLRWLFRADLTQKPKNVKAIMNLDPAEALNDWKAARKVIIVLCFTLLFFFLQETLHISPAFIALSAAAAAMFWVNPDIRDTFRRVEWTVIIFFAALFVMVGGLKASGLLGALSMLLVRGNVLSPVLMGVLLLWIVAALSSIVDNVPITIAMIPVIQGLGAAGMQVDPLWWALVFGAGFGGNGTIIGSSANIVVATLSERTRTPISPALWNKRGLPVMVATCAIATILYVLLYSFLSVR
ncbi:MAG: ArsB/NhaD family transporter [Anaerolineales bacterium]|nr:ArsB/NhaD family transporter [Anaerolineales bacterium]